MRPVILAAVILGGWLPAAPGVTEDNDTCLACHGQRGGEAPFVDAARFRASIHGGNLCLSCHEDAAQPPHAANLKPVACGTCHRLETEVYLQSDHGKALSRGVSAAATCTSCHGHTHSLLSSRDPRSPVHRTHIAETCATCHADKKRMAGFRLTQQEPFDTYSHSVHGEAFRAGRVNAATCSDCHGTHDLHGAANPLSKVYRGNVAGTCGRCHENVKSIFDRSIHGRAGRDGIREAPVCTDCHGEHTIRTVRDPASQVYRGAVTKTCSGCHESERIIAKFGLPADRLKTFMDSYHGLASRWGDLHAANCASCHGWHDILPSADTQSSIHERNLPKTCGKCHPGARSTPARGRIHGGERTDEFPLVRLARLFYLLVIPLTIGGMLLHNAADYLRKALAGPGEVHEGDAERMNPNERLQHAVLLVTFTTLAYTGFALKYPDAWWGAPFQFTGGGEALRKGVHRWTALAFMLAGAYHLAYMLGTARGRDLLRNRLWPKLRDLTDPVALLAYNLGLRRERPVLPYPSYIERAEYWALVWGSLVMAATGTLLVFNDFTLKHFPLWVSNLATLVHFLEAVLACLSIPVWHFYWTIFDPDVYPMNWAWLTGKARREPRP